MILIDCESEKVKPFLHIFYTFHTSTMEIGFDIVERHMQMEKILRDRKIKKLEGTRRRRAVKRCLKNIVDTVCRVNSSPERIISSKKRKRVEERDTFENSGDVSTHVVSLSPADDLGYGSSTLSLNRIETSKMSTEKTKKKKVGRNLENLPREYQTHLRSWVEQRKYQWKMSRENDELERLLGIRNKLDVNNVSPASSLSLTSPETLQSVHIFESSTNLFIDNEISILADQGTKVHANHYFRAAGGVNSIVVLCEAVKSELIEVSDWGVSSRGPCEKINWIRVSDRMKSVSDRWNPSFCRAMWQFVQTQRL